MLEPLVAPAQLPPSMGFSGPSGLSAFQSSHTPPQLWILTLTLFCEMLSRNTRVPGTILLMKVFSDISEQFCHTLQAVLNSPSFMSKMFNSFPLIYFYA